MRIACDIDGVLRNFISSLNLVYDQVYAKEESYWREPVKTWELAPYYSIGKCIYDFAFNIYAYDIFINAKPYEGAVEFMKKLNNKHDVVIATSQNRKTLEYAVRWLNEKDITYNDFYAKVGGYGSHNNKNGVVADVLLDDRVENLESFKGLSICMDRPWNQNWDGLRIHSLEELFKYVI